MDRASERLLAGTDGFPFRAGLKAPLPREKAVFGPWPRGGYRLQLFTLFLSEPWANIYTVLRRLKIGRGCHESCNNFTSQNNCHTMIVMKGNKAACKGVLLSTRSLLLERKYWHTLLLKPSESYSKFSFIFLVHCASF